MQRVTPSGEQGEGVGGKFTLVEEALLLHGNIQYWLKLPYAYSLFITIYVWLVHVEGGGVDMISS